VRRICALVASLQRAVQNSAEANALSIEPMAQPLLAVRSKWPIHPRWHRQMCGGMVAPLLWEGRCGTGAAARRNL